VYGDGGIVIKNIKEVLMEKTNNLKARLNGLFKEMEEIKALLEAEEVEEAKEEVSEVLENEPVKSDEQAIAEKEPLEEVDEETGEESEVVEEPKPVADEQQEEEQEPVNEEEAIEDNTEEEPAVDPAEEPEPVVEAEATEPAVNDVPAMSKQENSNASIADDETGEELPVDFEQIIEAQQAKITALQAENAKLKTRVEGAFGYSAKPAGSVKVNKLYDDALDLSFHK